MSRNFMKEEGLVVLPPAKAVMVVGMARMELAKMMGRTPAMLT